MHKFSQKLRKTLEKLQNDTTLRIFQKENCKRKFAIWNISFLITEVKYPMTLSEILHRNEEKFVWTEIIDPSPLKAGVIYEEIFLKNGQQK